MENNQPIIVKRVKKTAGGHHGGAWKIAFADFATAMMAFFLVMWLMTSATPEQKKAISGYFQDPYRFHRECQSIRYRPGRHAYASARAHSQSGHLRDAGESTG